MAVAVLPGAVPAKIVVKGTGRMSLNDRFQHQPSSDTRNRVLGNQSMTSFTELTTRLEEQKVSLRMDGFGNNTNSNNNNVIISAANRRLAHQMENRPAVIAALRLRRKSVKQRLGAKARLGNGLNGGGSMNGFSRGGGFNRSRLGGFGGLGRSFKRQRNNIPRNFFFNQSPFRRNGAIGWQRFGGVRRRFRGGTMRGFRGGFGRGGRRGFGGSKFNQQRRPQMDKDSLDRELDEYMSKTKTQLDAELESYMADASV